MNDENDNGRGAGPRAPLTLKPRPGGLSSGTVKQSFSHGRSKTVVVETKRRRVDAPVQNLAAPTPSEKRAALDVRPAAAPAPRPAAPAGAAAAVCARAGPVADIANPATLLRSKALINDVFFGFFI